MEAALAAPEVQPQARLIGRRLGQRRAESLAVIPFSGVLGFLSAAGSETEARAFRAWKTEPAGWFRFSTDAGFRTLVLTGAPRFLRPNFLNQLVLERGERLGGLRPTPGANRGSKP